MCVSVQTSTSSIMWKAFQPNQWSSIIRRYHALHLLLCDSTGQLNAQSVHFNQWVIRHHYCYRVCVWPTVSWYCQIQTHICTIVRLHVVKTLYHSPVSGVCLCFTYSMSIWSGHHVRKRLNEEFQHLLPQRSITYLKAWKLAAPPPPKTPIYFLSLLFLP